MGYKLHCEKKHRMTKGGKRPMRIEKGVPFGRTLSTTYRPGGDPEGVGGHIITMHATKGPRARSLRSMGLT